jgi:ABC-2 type transport system permease protein
MTAADATFTSGPQITIPGPRRVFLQILWRDVFVTLRSVPTFLAQVVLQPLFLVFVFGKVLTDLGYARAGYSNLLLPGVIALTCVLTGLQGTALPMVIDFSYTREIEDRLMAPLPTAAVALEKVAFGALRGLIAAVVMFPVGILVLGHIPFDTARLPLLVVVLVLATIVGAAMGLSLGALVQPDQINIVFALVLTPLLFTGCSQYPWPSLSVLPWFKVVTLFNPLTYASEGMRASMEPSVAHMNPAIAVVVLAACCVGFTALGVWGFRRRALD